MRSQVAYLLPLLLLDIEPKNEFIPKALVSGISLLIGLAIIFFVTPGHIDSGAWWTLGKKNSFRRMLYDENDMFRKHAKAGIVAWLVIANVILWFLF